MEINLTETEIKCFEYVTSDTIGWIQNVSSERARVAKEEIIAKLVEHCNANEIALAVGEDAQVTQAYDLGVVETAAERQTAMEAAFDAE